MKIKSDELDQMWCRHAFYAQWSGSGAASANRMSDGRPMFTCIGKKCPDFIMNNNNDDSYDGSCGAGKK